MRGSVVYFWLMNRIQSLATLYAAYSTMFALLATLLAVAVLLVLSLIPLLINESSSQALGEQYCINNYSMTIGLQIPQYNTSFSTNMVSGTYSISSFTTFIPGVVNCAGPINISTSENVVITDVCSYTLLSIIYPAVPNAAVFQNYALSEACYRTLQSCDYDPLLSACLLSSCFIVSSTSSSTNGSYPLTYYTLQCTANIYYSVRCTDDGIYSRLYYSASQQNSACRQKRLNRINTCLNSNVQLANVPCSISVSSGIVTNTAATCTQSGTTTPFTLAFYSGVGTNSTSANSVNAIGPSTLTPSFTTTAFAASDQSSGHAYRVSSVNSQTYSSSQVGAIYCGAVSTSQIASSVSTAVNSQNSF